MASKLARFQSSGFLLIDTPKFVYAAHVDNEDSLHQRIVDVCQIIHKRPGNYEQMRWSLMMLVVA
jgi:hypothetical protein